MISFDSPLNSHVNSMTIIKYLLCARPCQPLFKILAASVQSLSLQVGVILLVLQIRELRHRDMLVSDNSRSQHGLAPLSKMLLQLVLQEPDCGLFRGSPMIQLKVGCSLPLFHIPTGKNPHFKVPSPIKSSVLNA